MILGVREAMGLRLFIFLGTFFLFEICVNGERQIPVFDLVFLAFLLYFLFWEERDIKFEQKYLFTLDFNRGGLRKTNGTYHRWVSVILFKPRVGKVIFAQTTCGLCVITPLKNLVLVFLV